MANSIRKIDLLTEELQRLLPMKEEYQRLLDKKFRLEFNFNSNHIEGNTLTYGETELLLLFDKTTGNHDLREYEEMKAHDVAFNFIRELAAKKETPITEADIKNLNKILLVRPFWKDAITNNGQPTRREIKVGDYKQFPNSVRLQNGEIFHYASPAETPIKMGELMEWFRAEEEKKELHPAALAALFHYRFVLIHPFDDGNGRISRLMMNYVLLKNNLPPVIIKSNDKKNYLFALNQADTGDLEAFVEYIGEQLAWSLKVSIKAAKGESVEEADDFDKELELLKRSLKPVEGKIRKSRKGLITLWQNSLQYLFDEYLTTYEKFSGLFDNPNSEVLFAESGYSASSIEDKRDADIFFDRLSDVDRFSEITMTAFLRNLKSTSYSTELHFQIVLRDFDYEIISKVRSISRKYGEFLSPNEIKDLVKENSKLLLEELQNQTK